MLAVGKVTSLQVIPSTEYPALSVPSPTAIYAPAIAVPVVVIAVILPSVESIALTVMLMLLAGAAPPTAVPAMVNTLPTTKSKPGLLIVTVYIPFVRTTLYVELDPTPPVALRPV